MPESQPATVVERYEELRELLPDLENINALHDELDLLNEVLGDQEYQALGEVYDILTMQIPAAEEGSVNLLVSNILDTINTEYKPPRHQREFRDIILSDHVKAFLEAYEDIVTKAYASDNDDSLEFGKPDVEIVETNVDSGKPVYRQVEEIPYNNKRDDDHRRNNNNNRNERRPRRPEEDDYIENEKRRGRGKKESPKSERKPKLAVEEDFNDNDVKEHDRSREGKNRDERNDRRKPHKPDGEDYNENDVKELDRSREGKNRDEKNDRRKPYRPDGEDYNENDVKEHDRSREGKNRERDDNDRNDRRKPRRSDGEDFSGSDREPDRRRDKGMEDFAKQDRKPEGYGSYDPPAPVFDQYRENHRYVLLRKAANEPLGITVRQNEDDSLFIAKIRQNSLADAQSNLQVGDIVKEVNGEPVFVPEDLMAILKDVEEWIIIKIVPNDPTQYNNSVSFVRACVSYNPMTDRLIPYKKVGLSYEKGDMLAIVDDSDQNWWQARIIDGEDGPLGLIPSRTLQEKRQVFVNPETTKAKSSLLCGMGRKKKKVGYDAANAAEYEDGHVKIYEEVELSESFRCSLILIGADKESKRYLKDRLVREFPSKYATVVPETSRPMKQKDRQGKGFVFTDIQNVKDGIKKNLYIQEGEYNGNWYGIRVSGVRDVINSSKMCVLDVAPQYLKTLMCQEFRPLVVFIAAPRWESIKARKGYKKGGRRINNNRDEEEEDDNEEEERCRNLEQDSMAMKDRYRKNFDEVIINDDMENTFHNLVAFVDSAMSAKKWVPKNWGKTL